MRYDDDDEFLRHSVRKNNRYLCIVNKLLWLQ